MIRTRPDEAAWDGSGRGLSASGMADSGKGRGASGPCEIKRNSNSEDGAKQSSHVVINHHGRHGKHGKKRRRLGAFPSGSLSGSFFRVFRVFRGFSLTVTPGV